MTTALIDGDMLIYRSGFAVEKQCYRIFYSNGNVHDCESDYTKTELKKQLKDDGLTEGEDYSFDSYKTYEPLENALYLCKQQIESVRYATKADDFRLFLSASDGSNFRYVVATTVGPRGAGYKAGRPPKPRYYSEIRQYLLDMEETEEVYGMEADDALGIAQCQGTDTIICTQDKDLDMIPGAHYNFVSEKFYQCIDPGSLYLTSNNRKLQGEGVKWFYAQMLLGDSVDNIPGVEKYGPVSVYNALGDLSTEEQLARAVIEIYQHNFDNYKARLLEVCDLLWILRDPAERKSKYLESLL